MQIRKAIAADKKYSGDSKQKNPLRAHFFHTVSANILTHSASFLERRDYYAFFTSSSSLYRFMKNNAVTKKRSADFYDNHFEMARLSYCNWQKENQLTIHIKRLNSKEKVFQWRLGRKTFAPLDSDHPYMVSLTRTMSNPPKEKAVQFVKSLGKGAILQRFIASHDYRNYFIMTNQGVFAWGSNSHGQRGTECDSDDKICRIEALNGIPIRDILATQFSTFFIGDQHTYACGDNALGQLGLLTEKSIQSIPLEVKALSGVQVRNIFNFYDEGPGVRIFFDTDHGLMVAGSSGFHLRRLMNIEEKPLKKLNLPDHVVVKNIVVSKEILSDGEFFSNEYPYSVYLITNQGVFSFGKNDKGQLGTNDKLNRDIPEKIYIPGQVLDAVAEPTFALFLTLVDKKLCIYACGKWAPYKLEETVPTENPRLSLSLDEIFKEEQRRCLVM